MQLVLFDGKGRPVRPPPVPIRHQLPKEGPEVKEVIVGKEQTTSLTQATTTVLARVGVDAGETVQWSDEEVARLHGYLLERTLATLTERALTPPYIAEVLSWIYDEGDISLKLVRSDGMTVYLRAEDIPFSFARCCKLSGCDPDEIRERLPALLAQLKRPIYIDYV